MLDNYDHRISSIKDSISKASNRLKILDFYFEVIHTYSEILQPEIASTIPGDDRYKKFIYTLPELREEIQNILVYLNEVINNLKSLKISQQYEDLLTREFVNFDWGNMHQLHDHEYYQVQQYLINIKNGNLVNNRFAITALNWTWQNYNMYLSMYRNKITILKIFDKIKHIQNNIVLIGANGSGKSKFARNLKKCLSSNFTIIPAQHILFYNKPISIELNSSSFSRVYDFQASEKLGREYNLSNLLLDDVKNLILALYDEHNERTRAFYSGKEEKRESILNKTFRIWNSIVENLEMVFIDYDIEVKPIEGSNYKFNDLSDGERAIFYYIAHILFAKPNSYIVIDEPENHLHPSICNKLWDILESERNDCIFIYITHNIDFASSRINATVLWNKKFIPPLSWYFEQLPLDSEIPEKLLIELLGSKRDILFCEGKDRTSYDSMLYEILFPQYTIKPVDGHMNVINYCKAFNRNKEFFGRSAIGIIDGDCHSNEQIESWKSENIYTLPVNEIENLLCDEIIIEKATKRFLSKDSAIQEYKNKFFNEMNKKLEYQATLYARDKVNILLKSELLKANQGKKEYLKSEYEKLIKDNLIDMFYAERESALKDVIEKNDYAGALKICGLKKELIGSIASIIDKEYKRKVIPLITEDKELQEYIKTTYFNWDKLQP